MNAKNLKSLRRAVRRVTTREGFPHRLHVEGTPGYRRVFAGVHLDGSPRYAAFQITGTVTNHERSFRGLYRWAKAQHAAQK